MANHVHHSEDYRMRWPIQFAVLLQLLVFLSWVMICPSILQFAAGAMLFEPTEREIFNQLFSTINNILNLEGFQLDFKTLTRM